MDYRKIIIYILIIVVAAGYWYKRKQDDKSRAEAYDRFASIYAATAVLAELYRNEPERLIRARDSLYECYGMAADSLEAFKRSLEGNEEEWSLIWAAVKRKTDSLIEYYTAHPIEHGADSAKTVKDSTAAFSPSK